MKETLKPGLTHEFTFRVPDSKTVAALYPESPEFQQMPRVFATGFLVGLVEWACLQGINPHLDWPKEQTVGTLVNLSHTAATPPGMLVTVKVTLAQVDGRRLVFQVSARDESDTITEGTHERFVIAAERFNQRVAEKARRASGRGVDSVPAQSGRHPMNTRSGAIRFHFDYISSNAYLAWAQIHDLAARHGRALEPVPVLFAGLLEAHGQLGPAEVAPKALWMVKNNLRKAAVLGVPLHPPAHHPWNPLLSLRVSSLPMPEETRHRLIDGLFRAAWVNGLHISEPDVVARIANDAGLEGRTAVDAAQQPEAKERLRRQTEDAVAEGVFGVPTMIVDGELFWGYDDFPWFERFLAGTDALGPEMLQEWMNPVTPSAVRPPEKRGRRR